MKKALLVMVMSALVLGLNANTTAPEAITLPDVEISMTNEKLTKKELKFPALKKVDGYIPVLKATIFFKYRHAAGWTNGAVLQLNGKNFLGETAAKNPRLLRRGKFMLNKIRGKEYKRAYFNGNSLLVYFGTGKPDGVDKRIVSPREEGFDYHFDISDLVSYTKENTLMFGSTLTLKTMSGRNTPLNFKNMKIMYVKESEAAKLRK